MINANLGRRIGAMIYDGLLVLALLFIGTMPFIMSRDGESVNAGTISLQITLALIIYLFFTGFWMLHGRTLGMQSWGLRIETPDGGKPSLRQCSIRFFAALLSWAPLAAGFIWQLIDKDGLSWHDRLSGTRLRHYPRKNSCA